MNWKIVVGALLVFGGLKELFVNIIDSSSHDAVFNFPRTLGCLTLAAVGTYMILRGKRDRKKL